MKTWLPIFLFSIISLATKRKVLDPHLILNIWRLKFHCSFVKDVVKIFPVSHHTLYLNTNKHERLWTQWCHWIYYNDTLLPLNLQTEEFLAQKYTTTRIAMFTPISSVESHSNVHTQIIFVFIKYHQQCSFHFNRKHKVFQSMRTDIISYYSITHRGTTKHRVMSRFS